jgi:uncharacterized membrane protein HdeD (DUF308 family)
MSPIVRGWWAVMARGMVAVAFGGIAVVFPMEPAQLSMLFGITALMLGALAVAASIGAPFNLRRGLAEVAWPMFIEGIVGAGLGIAMIATPLPPASLALCLGAWAGITGLMEIATALNLHRVLASERTLTVAGIASIAAATLFIVRGGDFDLAQSILGVYAVLFGAFLVVAGVRLHRWEEGDLADA